MTATFTRPDPISSPTVVFLRPNNPIAPLVNEKKEGISRGARHLLTFLKRAIPKTLFVCTCMGPNRGALPAFLVGNQVFELRHDSIGGKVTTGQEGLRKAPTTIAPKFGRSLSNDLERSTL